MSIALHVWLMRAQLYPDRTLDEVKFGATDTAHLFRVVAAFVQECHAMVRALPVCDALCRHESRAQHTGQPPGHLRPDQIRPDRLSIID